MMTVEQAIKRLEGLDYTISYSTYKDLYAVVWNEDLTASIYTAKEMIEIAEEIGEDNTINEFTDSLDSITGYPI